MATTRTTRVHAAAVAVPSVAVVFGGNHGDLW